MFRSLIGLSALSLTLAFSVGCGSDAVDPSAPESVIMIPVTALKNNDLKTALTSIAPDEAMSDMQQQWNSNKNDFADQAGMILPMLSAENASEVLAPQIEMGLKNVNPTELAGQLRSMSGMVMMFAPSPETGTQLKAIAESAAKWVESAGLDDPAKAKKAVDLISAGLRNAGITNAEAIKSLDFDAMLVKSGALFGTAKEAATVYGMDIQGMLNSFAASKKDDAKVSVNAKILGSPLNFDVPVKKVGDSWEINSDANAEGKGAVSPY